MQNLRNLIPSTNLLFAFEAAARLGSFTLAASELNVSQPAVSRSIRLLEENLGVCLFIRRHRKISLTREGRRFYRDVTSGFEHIYYAARDLQMDRVREIVTISGSTLFIHYWMLPRLSALEQMFPNLDIRLHSTDRDVSLVAEGIDISVRLGDGRWADYDASLFAEEIVYPVCSPDYLDRQGPVCQAEDLFNQRLLYVDEPFRIRMTWRDWFRHIGVNGREDCPPVRFNDAQICLQAALRGEGIALGWNHVVAPLIGAGKLVRLLSQHYQGANAMYLLTPRRNGPSDEVARIRDWMLQAMRQQTRRMAPFLGRQAFDATRKDRKYAWKD